LFITPLMVVCRECKESDILFPDATDPKYEPSPIYFNWRKDEENSFGYVFCYVGYGGGALPRGTGKGGSSQNEASAAGD
jgi:hypothetical protein